MARRSPLPSCPVAARVLPYAARIPGGCRHGRRSRPSAPGLASSTAPANLEGCHNSLAVWPRLLSPVSASSTTWNRSEWRTAFWPRLTPPSGTAPAVAHISFAVVKSTIAGCPTYGGEHRHLSGTEWFHCWRSKQKRRLKGLSENRSHSHRGLRYLRIQAWALSAAECTIPQTPEDFKPVYRLCESRA